MFSPVLLLLAFSAGVLAGPINVRLGEPNECALRCTESSKFKYEPGTTYVFDYMVQTETSMEGASEDKAVLGIRATAHIEVLSKCDMALRLSDVVLSPANPDYIPALEDNTIRFSFQDGKIEDLCPLPEEKDWTMNIKKGVLSVFQNSMDNLEVDQTVHETDVTGECPAEYKLVKKGWYVKAIKKTKHLLGCMDRHGWRSSMQAAAYRVPSEVQTLPLMKSEHVCDQEIENRGYLKSALCKETHVFRPFSHYNNGSMTKVVQKLTFRNQQRNIRTRQSSIDRRASLLFSHSTGQQNMDRQEQKVRETLRQLCTLTVNDIRPEVPMLFSQLIFQMRGLDASTLRSIYRETTRGNICSENVEKTKKFFQDAIPMLGTSSSVQILKELIMNKAVTGIEADMWLSSLALIQDPTVEMLAEVKALLDIRELGDEPMLYISALVNNYCTKHTNCAEDFEVTGIISTLQRNLGYGCVVRDENLEKVLMTLRALGNAGHSTTVGSAITYCFSRESNPIEVRVAALDAFRRLPCSTERTEAMDLLKDKDEDSELRIAAYLAVMKCPTEDTIDEVRNILAKEETNQVGSFIWSHLTNLMETSSPHKEALRSIVDDQRLKKEFDLEKIKFSRNYEGSFLFERINTGAMAESNVIWSSKSFIPRSAMLNLTIDLFGNSVNLLEVGGRIEGFEYLMETYLGPYGYFGQQHSKKSIEKSRAKLDQLRGSMYMRIFGNEMMYKHFKGFDSIKSPNFNFLEFLIKISKKHDYSFSQSSMFLDSSMIIPTSCGLPLNLTVTGVSSIDMKASGTVDLRKVAARPRSLNIDGIIKPSGAVTISGSMSVDGLFSKSGMKMTTTLHTSTELNGRIKLERGKILEVELDTPQDKMEILDIKSAFFTIMGNKEKEQAMITENKKGRSFCTGNKMAKIVGMELCGEIQYPNASMVDAAPYFPFTGPVNVNLILHKRDTHVAYRLMAKRLETKEKSIAQLAFTTPGSRVKRAISVDYALDFNKKEMEISSTSPWTNMVLKGNVVLEEEKKSFEGSFTKDGKLYGIRSVVDVKNEQKMTKLSPKVEIIRPGMKDIVLAGTVDVEGTKRFDTDLSLINAISHPISMRGTIIDTKKEKSVKASVQFDESGEYSLNAVLQSDFSPNKKFLRVIPKLIVKTPVEHLITVDGHVEHRLGKLLRGELNTNVKDLLRKPISVKFINVISNRKKYTKYDTDLKITSKWLTAKVDSTLNKGKNGQMSSRVVVDYNLNKISKNKLIFGGKFTNKTTSLTKYTLNTNFDNKKNPEYNFNTNLDLSHNNKHSEATIDVRYGKDLNDKSKKTKDRVFLDATVNRKGGWKSARVDYKFIAEIPNKDVAVILEGDHKHDRNDLINKMVFTSNKAEKARTNLKLNYKNSKQINVGGDFTLVYPGNNININSDLTQKKKEYTHSLNMKINKKKSTMTTVYSQPGKGRHQITSDVSLHFLKPISISGNTNLNMDKFKASADVKYGKDKYGFETSKTSKDNYNHAIGVSAYCPERSLTADLETKMSGNTYGGRFITNWDAAQKKSSTRVVVVGSSEIKSLADMNGMVKIVYPGRTINMNGEHRHQGLQNINSHVDLSWSPREKIAVDMNHQTDSYNKISSDFTITTPFKVLRKLSTEMSYGNNPNDVVTSAKVTYGRNHIVSTDVTIKKPFSLIRSNIDLNVHTFFKNFRDLKAKLSHSIGERLRATASGSLDGRNINLDISGQQASRGNTDSVEGTITLTSDFEAVKSIVVRSSAALSNQKFVANVYLDHNGQSYKYDLDMMDRSYLSNKDYSGKITVTAPYYRGHYEGSAMMNDRDVKLTVNSDLGKGKQIYLDISGKHDLEVTGTLTSKVVLRTPWKPVRNIDIDITHKHGLGLIAHNTIVKSNGKVIGSGELNYKRQPNNVAFSAKATSPFTEDLSTSIETTTQVPYTSRMEIIWSPRQKIIVDSYFYGDIPTLGGTFRLVTPFQQARNIFLSVSNKQDGEDWVSSGNLEYGIRKAINLETRLGVGDKKIARAVLTTPFRTLTRLESGMELTANGYDINGQADFQLEPVVGKFSASVNADWSADITGKARLDTPYSEFPYTQVELSSKKDTKGRHSKMEIEYSPRQIISVDTLYSFEYPIVFDIELKTPFEHLQDVGGKVRHNMGRRGIQTHAEVTYAPYKTIESDLKLKWKNGIDGKVVVKTPFAGYEDSRSTFTHNGVLTDFQTHGEVEVANKRMDVDLTFRHGLDTSAEFIFHSPYEGFEELKASMTKRGELDDINVGTTVSYGNNQEITVDAHNKMDTGILKSGLTFKNPYTSPFKFDIDFNGMPTAFNLQVDSSFGRDNKIEHQTRCVIRLPRIDITNNFEYLLADEGKKFGFKVNTEGDQWTDVKYTTEATCDDHKASVSGYWKMMDKIMGSLMITAPSVMEDDITAAFSHEGTLGRFDTSASLRFLDQAYSGKINLYQDGIRQIRTSGELTTPFQGYEDMKYDYNHEFTGYSLVGHAKATYGYNKEIVAEVDVALAPNMSGTLTVNTPFEHYRENKLVLLKKGEPNDMVIETSFQNNRKPVFKYVITHVYLPRRMESSLSFEGIFMEDINASFKHTGEPMVDCHTEIKSSCGKLMSASYTSDIKRTRRGMTVDLNGEYAYYGQGQTASLNMVRDGEWDDGTVRATGRLNGKEVSAQGTYAFRSNKADIDATANTPFQGFRDLSANIHYTLNDNKLDANTALQYMDGQRISVKGYLHQDNNWRYMDSDVEVSTPFRGFENNKFKYTGNMDGSTLDVSTSIENRRLQKIASSLKVKSAYENSLDWTLTTPFKGYEDLSFTTNMKKDINKPSIDVRFRNGPKDFQILGDLNREVRPVTGEIRVITPIENFERTDISFSHSGSLDNFKSSATFDSRLTGRMDGEASLKYISPLNMDINAEVRSRVPYMEDLAFKIKTNENRNDKSGYMMTKWSNRDIIELEGSYKERSRWSSEQRIGELRLATPFEALKTASVNLDWNKNGDKYSEKLSATLNDKSVVDMDVDVTISDVPEISARMDKPYPVQVTVSGQNGHTIGGDVFVNWDTTDREKNVRIQSSFTPNGGRYDTDKEFNIKLIHPVRTFGINGFIQTSDKHVKSNGAIIWNENKGQKFAYDLDVADNTRRNKVAMDGSLKLVFPDRSLAFQGAVKNVRNRKSVDGYIMWDADKDDDKKIGMKAVMVPGARTNKFDVTLSIPTIQRDIKIDSEITVDSGRVIFDGKTEFSYSTDSSKTLVLTSNVKDVSYDRDHKNYTMSLGIRHSYTDTDVQLTSHIGHSTDRYSTGMELQYLTASRQRMNMVVLGEIDQLRRQINIEVLNPMKKMRILGEVESVTPFKASIKNEIDDQPGVSAAVAFSDRSFDFQTHYDINDMGKSFHVEGEYINSTAVKADAYSMINGQKIADSMMTARLNTSRILHTRITWRPTLLSELEMFSAKQVESFMAASEAMSQEAKAEIGREIQYKYNRIMRAVNEEMKPYIELLREELVHFESQLEYIIQEIRRTYSRNDLYIRNMGDKINEYYLRTHMGLRELVGQYRESYNQMFNQISTHMEKVKAYPIRQKYYELLYTGERMADELLEDISEWLIECTKLMKVYIDKQSMSLRQNIDLAKENIVNHPYVQLLKEKVRDLKNIDYAGYARDYSEKLGKKVESLDISGRYTNAVNNIHGLVNHHIDELMKREDVKYMHSIVNEAYQEGKWAFNYWGVEENMKKQMHEMYSMLKQLIRSEIEAYKHQYFTILPRYNVTYYNPSQAELQADIYLPLPVTALDKVPDDVISAYVDDAKRMANNYLPTKESVMKLYYDYFPQTTNETDIDKEFKEYMAIPTKRRLRTRRLRQRKQ